MYFITTKRMLEVCFSAHPNIQYRTLLMTVTCARSVQVIVFDGSEKFTDQFSSSGKGE